jgi:hypothetical protein
MKLVPNRFSILCAVLGLASFLNFSAQAQLTTISDSTGDINAGISTGGGTLDIVKMEVGDTASDVVLKLTVNGNISSTDWGNFMIGIANQKAAGTTTGNGWNRPINLNAGVTNGVTNGMTHWIGSWVGGGGGNQLWTHTSGTSFSGPATLAGYSLSPGAQSVITYTVSKASLGVVNGDTIKFDAYSSGGGGGDSAVDALANPSTSITSWGQTYTSSGANLASYTLANTLANATTQEITFSVNMSHQILLGTFNPVTDAVTVDWGDFTNFIALTAAGNGVYTGSATIQAPQGLAVPYRFTIEPADLAAPLISETVSRFFDMPNAATTISPIYFNNIEGYRDVTFSVNMSVQQTLGNFNPATQTVEVRGPFNAWAGTALTAQGEGVYSGTVRVSGAAAAVPYKFFAGGYEAGGDRTFTLAFNSDRAPTPAQVLDTVFYSNVNTVPDFRLVTFAVNMSQQISLGRFNPATDFLEIRGGMNSWGGGTTWRLADGDSDGIYTGTFNIEGTAATTVEYKFYNTAVGIGYETTPNRSLVLGPVQTPQTASTVYFNNDSGQTRQVTFAVDMSVQEQIGNFNPATGVVQLRGLGGFGDTQAQALIREGTTLTYSGTFAVPGDSATDFAYKFWATGATFEVINPNDIYLNRTLTLGASGTPQIAPTVFFSNVSLPPPSALSYTPSSASGTVGTPISSLTPTVTGTVTSYSVSPALPLGLSLDESSGVISGTPTAVSASASYTVTATNGTGSTTAAVTIEVGAPAGSTFAGWSNGADLNSENLAKYAIGGTSGPNAQGEAPTVGKGFIVPNHYTYIEAIVRTDDSKLSFLAEASTDLSAGFSSTGTWTTEGLSQGVSQQDVPSGCERKKFIYWHGMAQNKMFLRLKATLAP